MYEQWLESLRAGSLVAVPRPYNSGDEVLPVARVTPTQIILPSGGRYRKSDGRSIGTSTWHAHRLKEATQDVLRADTVRKARSVIEEVAQGRRKVSDDAILQMAAIAKATQS